MDPDFGWPNLADAYAELQGQIEHVHSEYPDTAEEDPTSDEDEDEEAPGYQDHPPQPPPVSQIQLEVKERAKRLTSLRSNLVRRRGFVLIALDKVNSGRDWQSDIDYWVQQSQEAQIRAVMNCLDLLLGVAGPVREAIRTHRFNSALLWSRYLEKKSAMESIGAALKSHELSSPAAELAAKSLAGDIGEISTKLSSEALLLDVYTVLDKWGIRVEHAVKSIGVVHSCAEKHNLLLAAHQIGDFLAGQVADMGLVTIEKALIKAGSLTWAEGLMVADFFVKYGYNSFRFYTAFTNVHNILADMENTVAAASRLRAMAEETSRQIRDIDSALNQLKQVQGNDAQAAKLLKTLKAARYRTAFNAGIGTAYTLAAPPDRRGFKKLGRLP